MAEVSLASRDKDTRKFLSWTELLRTFLIALDPFKLLIAAFGILFTACGWWLISVVYFNSWTEVKIDNRDTEINDRKNAMMKEGLDQETAENRARAEFDREYRRYKMMEAMASRGAKFRTMPWLEDRGPNQFLLANQVIRGGAEERREVVSWFASNQVPVLIEPLLKFLYPIIVLFDADANFWVRSYLLFLIIWMLIVWAFVAGVITRMAIVQIAGKQGGGLRDSISYVKQRYSAYVLSPLVPLLIILAIVIGCMFFGIFHMIPIFGDIIVDGFGWWIILGAGFIMTLLLVGLVGYPLMYTTLSAEGSDTFDALSRSYNYVYESPWSYLWYSFIAVMYGAVVIFFVVFMTSLMVYLGKWGVSQTPMPAGRQPDFLFIYSPTSFGWRELMLRGSPVAVTRDISQVKDPTRIVAQTDKHYYVDPVAAEAYMKEFNWWNHAGAGMVAFWMTLLFMLMLGFSYSYFWTAASMIYLLMRQKVDETSADEIFVGEEEFEAAPPQTPAPATSAPTTIPVDAPTLRTTTTPSAPPAPQVPPPTPPAPPAPPAPPTPPTPPTPTIAPPTPPASETPTPSSPPTPPASSEGEGSNGTPNA